MIILRKKEYLIALKAILSFISKDSKNRVINFKNNLDDKIEDLKLFPFKFKQSQNSDDINVRDMIYKGYTITYLIENVNNRILILDIITDVTHYKHT